MGSVEDVSSPGRSSRGGLGVGFTGRGVDESGASLWRHLRGPEGRFLDKHTD